MFQIVYIAQGEKNRNLQFQYTFWLHYFATLII